MVHNKKVADEVIIEAYKRLNSVWAVGIEVGLCGQSVHERLKKLGLSNPVNVLSEEHKQILLNEYDSYASKGELGILAKRLGRSKCLICRYAGQLGLTTLKRKKSGFTGFVSKVGTKFWGDGEHPRGMLGKKHTDKTKKRLSQKSKELFDEIKASGRMRGILIKTIKTKFEKNGSIAHERSGVSWKGEIRNIGGIDKYFRSTWEANYARFLQYEKENGRIVNWEHEVELFVFDKEKDGVVAYLPDFRITYNDNSVEYHEVKGWMDDDSKQKLKRMKKHYPDKKIIVIDKKWFKIHSHDLASKIEGWEKTKIFFNGTKD